MEAYTGFALVYDEFMDNIPYDEWGTYLIGLLKEYHIEKDMMIADLGCGTGAITQILDEEGYACVGIDNAPDMLTIATEKMYENEQQILYSLQDMRAFELPYPMDAMVSICDSMNYVTDIQDLESVFVHVKKGLKTGGIFIFDLKTIYFFQDILGSNTFAENRDDSAFIWENFYNEENRNNEYTLTVFVQDEDKRFDRYEENHVQHGFEREEVVQAATRAGLEVLAVYDAFTKEEPKQKSERLYYILQKRRSE